MAPDFDIPNPDDLVKDLLRETFGPTAAITIAFIIANAAWSWYGAVKSGAKLARSSRESAHRLSRMSGVAIVLGVVTTVVLLALQVVWLWASYVVGNGISYLFTGNPPREGPDWGQVLSSLHWDAISTGYVTASILAILVSYVLAHRSEDATALGLLIAAPAILWGLLTMLGSALGLLLAFLYWLSDDHFTLDPTARSMIILFVLSVLHITACNAAMKSPAVMFRIWRLYAQRADKV